MERRSTKKSGSQRASAAPRSRRSPIDIVATVVILAGVAFALGVFAMSFAHRGQWHSTSDLLRAFGLPLVVAALLPLSLRLSLFWRVNIAMVMVPAALALIAADLVFAEKDRKEVHVLNGKSVARFASEKRIEALRRRGYPADLFVGPQQMAYWRYYLRLDSADLVPLGGISGTETYLCSEAGEDVLYRSDEYGFNNPRGIWSKPMDLAIVGDSFAHGLCVPAPDQIVNIVRKSIPATVNLGILGAGPLSELAVLREYLVPHKPRVVAWMFYEGNDVDTVGQQPVMARKYLDSSFTQHLIERQAEIDSLLRSYTDLVLSAPVQKARRQATLASVLMLRHLRIALDVGLPVPPSKSIDDYQGLEKSLAAAKRAVDGWGGTMYFVYLPDSHRFDPRRMTRGEPHDDRVVYSRTMEIARKLGIPVIDLLPVFSADRDPKRFWYRPMSHYTPAGTRLVADRLLARLARDGALKRR